MSDVFVRIFVGYSSKYFLMIIPSTYILVFILAAFACRVLPEKGAGKLKLGELDGLRGFLAVSVMIHHYMVWLRVSYLGEAWGPPPINIFNQLGAGSVALFFMATGFVFYPRVLNGFAATNWLTVYTLRIFRIVPLVAVSAALVSLIAWYFGHGGDFSTYLPALLSWVTTYSEPNLFGLADTGRVNAYVLWSLWYEWIFYLLVLPAACLAMDWVKGRTPTWIVPLGIGLCSFALKKAGASLQILTYLPLFSMGMLAYEAQRREFLRRAFRAPTATIGAILLLSFAALASAAPYGWTMPIFAVFFTCVACGNSMLGVLRSRAAILLGQISFSIYLMHGIVEYCVFSNYSAYLNAERMSLLLPLIAAVVFLIALTTYAVIEAPMMAAGKKITRLLAPRAATTWQQDGEPSRTSVTA